MSYSILIGNAEIESSWDVEDGCFAQWAVSGHSEPDAPNFPFDGMTENSNGRHPGYSQWADFCRATGLHELFYGATGGILNRHPGCVPLTAGMLETVRSALAQWKARHPDAIPGWNYDPEYMSFKGSRHVDDGVRGRDGNLARLLWLEWWMQWALTNCERPAISNS